MECLEGVALLLLCGEAAAERDDDLVDVLDVRAEIRAAAERNLDRRPGLERLDGLDGLVDFGLLVLQLLNLTFDLVDLLVERLQFLRELLELLLTATHHTAVTSEISTWLRLSPCSLPKRESTCSLATFSLLASTCFVKDFQPSRDRKRPLTVN